MDVKLHLDFSGDFRRIINSMDFKGKNGQTNLIDYLWYYQIST